MSTNRRRNANAIPIASFATWALIGIFACAVPLALKARAATQQTTE